MRARVRDWIEALVHSELDTALQRPRYGRSTGGETEPAVAPVRGYRNGSRTRTLTGTFRQDRHHGAACASARCGWRHHGMEEQGVAGVSAPDQGSRCADRFGVSVGDQHASGSAARSAALLRRGGRQGHGEPGAGARCRPIGTLERTTTEGRADRARLIPRRHGRPRASRQEATAISLTRRHRRARGRTEEVLLAVKRMGGDYGRLASCPRRPHEPRPSPSSVRDCRRRRGPRVRARACWNDVPMQRCTSPQASEPVGVRR